VVVQRELQGLSSQYCHPGAESKESNCCWWLMPQAWTSHTLPNVALQCNTLTQRSWLEKLTHHTRSSSLDNGLPGWHRQEESSSATKKRVIVHTNALILCKANLRDYVTRSCCHWATEEQPSVVCQNLATAGRYWPGCCCVLHCILGVRSRLLCSSNC
jgi:hypothetical protein